MPPSGETNDRISFLPLAEVKAGGSLFAHFTEAGQVMVLAVPSAVNIKLKFCDMLAVAGVLEIVKVVTEALKETVNTLETLKSRTRVPADIEGLLVGSLNVRVSHDAVPEPSIHVKTFPATGVVVVIFTVLKLTYHWHRALE